MSDRQIIIGCVALCVVGVGTAAVVMLRPKVEPLTSATVTPVVATTTTVPTTARAELPTRSTSRPVPPPAMGAPIEGAAWIVRESGSSEILRGVEVAALPTTVPGDLVRECLTYQESRIAQKVSELQFKVDEDAAAIQKNPELKNVFFASHTDDKRELAKWKEEAKDLDETLKGIGAKIDASVAYRTVKGSTQFGRVDFMPVVRRTRVGSARTNIDGKFTITGLPAGSYYLHARFATQTFVVEWLIPISVSSGPTKVDLFNENAVNIVNGPEKL